MIIPIKCFTCGSVLADQYRYYQETVRKNKLATGTSLVRIEYLTAGNVAKTVEGTVLDDMDITRVCCRRHMLTHVDIP
jgi:DNA-directed RNA polymerase subunit N (RpoN/RPB10)